MNSILDDEFPGFHTPRDLLLEMISDLDLSYKLPGHNPTLGELCLEIGQMQQVYTQSFRILALDWTYQGQQPDTPISIEHLRAWYKTLDDQMVEALSGFSQEDLHSKQIDRGQGFAPTPFVQFQIYREALLILFGKASVYLIALEKQLLDEWRIGIG